VQIGSPYLHSRLKRFGSPSVLAPRNHCLERGVRRLRRLADGGGRDAAAVHVVGVVAVKVGVARVATFDIYDIVAGGASPCSTVRSQSLSLYRL
jgi:hypothetical protein